MKPRNVEFIEEDESEETVKDEELLSNIVDALRKAAKWNTNIVLCDN